MNDGRSFYLEMWKRCFALNRFYGLRAIILTKSDRAWGYNYSSKTKNDRGIYL
ncbi:MAG: hypothetical protein ACOYME_09065 [Prochlorotrichaceae cyanobacterium]